MPDKNKYDFANKGIREQFYRGGMEMDFITNTMEGIAIVDSATRSGVARDATSVGGVANVDPKNRPLKRLNQQ